MMDRAEIKSEICAVIMAIPELELKPTMSNTKILDAIYNTLLKINDGLEEEENAGTDERVPDHPGGPDNA